MQAFSEFEGNDADFTETKMKAANAFQDMYDDYMIQMGSALDELDTAQATEQVSPPLLKRRNALDTF